MRLLLLLLALWVPQDSPHQHEHEMDRLGSVDFPVSCKTATVSFSRAVALLHSFGYEDARRAFLDIAADDPKCAMAHWGVAMTWYHPIWAPPTTTELEKGAPAIERAQAVTAPTQREKEFIAALALFYKDWRAVDHRTRAAAYEASMSAMHRKYPGDDEVTIFTALAMLGSADQNDLTFQKQKEAAKLLNAVLPRNPNHPGVAHYLIHSYDYPGLAELALPAARAYAKIAPDAPHAQHMPSHIFTRLGLWDESIASNIAAEKSARLRVARLHPGVSANGQLHAMDYLVYAYLQEGRDVSARTILDKMAATTGLDEQAEQSAYAFAATPQRYALERHDWKASAQLQLSPRWFTWSAYPQFEALAHYGRGIGAARSGDRELVSRELARMSDLEKQIAPTGGVDWAKSVHVQRETVEALLARDTVALRNAADHEDAIDKNAISPGVLIPVREMLGDLLLEKGQAAEALAAYEASLKIAPRRFNSVAGAARAAAQMGDRAEAASYYRELGALGAHAEAPRMELKEAKAYR